MPNSSETADIFIDRCNFKDNLAGLIELDTGCFPGDGWGENTWVGLFEHRDLWVYGVAVNGRLVGYLAAVGLKPEAELLRIGVLPEFRRRALGTGLLQRLVTTLAAERFQTVFLEVRRDNAPACSFYSRSGFMETAVRRDYYHYPICDALIFQLKIEP